MKVNLEPGKYIIAVSGGVDSVSLLHLLVQMQARCKQELESSDGSKQLLTDFSFLVAHYDHGIREDSAKDKQLVQKLSTQYGLPFVFAEGKLGKAASEETARSARYAFLRDAQKQYDARAIITAHHQDDVLETAILNLLRGTGRKGLTSLKSGDGLLRPLLHVSKSDIQTYAAKQHLTWREDSTNQETRYLRNYIRQNILPKFSSEHKKQLTDIVERSRSVNDSLDIGLADFLCTQANAINRQKFILLPHAIAKEVLASWLRANNLREFNRFMLERLVIAGKVGQPNTKVNVYGKYFIELKKDHLALTRFER
jgi:tRNA(Ile)-lysidine synthase